MKLSILVAALAGLGLWVFASSASPASQLSPVLSVSPTADGLLDPVRRAFRGGGGRSFRGGGFGGRSFSARSYRGGAVRRSTVARAGPRGRTVRRSTATRHVARGGTVRRGSATRHAARAGTARRSAATRNAARTGAARRTAAVVRRGNWTRPSRYWWRPGAAVAAGAAIGWVSAATAAAWAGSSPGPDMCWYYTDSSRTNGFWDVCP